MNKEIFLRDLSRFLSDIPQEEREQALKYYEDYFEDAGPEREQQVIEELGSPVDIAKQIKSINQENIEYGQGTGFHNTTSYPGVYGQDSSRNRSSQAGQNNYSQTGQNSSYTGQNGYSQNAYYQNASQAQTAGKRSWTQEPGKIALVIVLAILAIPVGIPIIGAAFSLIAGIAAVIFSLIIAVFALGGGLAIGGVTCIITTFGLIPAYGAATVALVAGIGLVLLAVGILIIWAGILFCSKFFPAAVNVLVKCCQSIGKGIKSFFH